MATKPLKDFPKKGFLLFVLFAGLWTSFSAGAAVDRTSSIAASGEGVIYDLKATANGTLRICTKPGRVGDRLRATIVQVNANGAFSAVGTGASTGFTGCTSRAVTSGFLYIVLVTWERPLPGSFPATITTRFTGPTDDTNPPVVGVNNAPLANLLPRPISFVEGGLGCPVEDGGTINLGDLRTNCRFNSTADTDTFKFWGPANGAVAIKIAGPSGSRWILKHPITGIDVCGSYGLGTCKLPVTGVYTIETDNIYSYTGFYSLSINGVSQNFQNGQPISPGQTKSGTLDAAADNDTFQFFCPANRIVSIKIVGPSGSRWIGYNPAGVAGPSSYGLGTATCSTSGTYTILIDNIYGYTGAYNVTLQHIAGP